MRISLATGFSPFRFLGTLCAAILFAVTSIPTTAFCGNDPECDDISAWTKFTRITLKQTTPDSEIFEWTGFFDQKTGDFSIDIATPGAKEPVTGTAGMVGGQVMLTKGLTLQPGHEIDAIDAPVLSMRVVMALLHRVFPNGPAQITGPTDIEHKGQVNIKFATPSASGYIQAPWQVKGKVSKGADGALSFELALSFPPEQSAIELELLIPPELSESNCFTVNMQGELAVHDQPVFRDADSLEGWTIYGVGPQRTQQGKSALLDYGAKPQEAAPYKTIGDIRAFLAAKNHPGVRDASKDFTGFWKQRCYESFGYQIKRHGDEGKYSIVFCGPCGCGDPAQSRLSFITGDKNYEVVSERELGMIDRMGDRDTYFRCSKDTNPPKVLTE